MEEDVVDRAISYRMLGNASLTQGRFMVNAPMCEQREKVNFDTSISTSTLM